MRVALVPMGSIPPKLLHGLADDLASYGLQCEVGEETGLPEGAFDPRCGQFDAERVLRSLATGEFDRVLAITSGDLFVKGMNFVFGLAAMGGPEALVSLHRLRTDNRERFRERLLKEAVHELGHTWGLSHCTNGGCVMRFSNSLLETDAKGHELCESCAKALPVRFILNPR